MILTDVTKTWLDMRTALRCKCLRFGVASWILMASWTADYDKTGLQYSRCFLWTTPRWYKPFLNAQRRALKADLEKIAGPFDAVVEVKF